MTPAKTNVDLSNKEQIDLIKDKMNDLMIQFIEETIDFSKKWMIKKADELIVSLPEFTSKLTSEQLRDLRSEVITKANNSEDDLRALLGDSSLWWHQDDSQEKTLNFYKSLDEFFGESYASIIGRVGEVLSKYGYLPKHDVLAFGFRAYKDTNNVYGFHYVDPIFWSYGMKQRMDNYWEEYKFTQNLETA